METVTEKEKVESSVEEVERQIDAFGVIQPVRKVPQIAQSPEDDALIIHYGLDVDTETHRTIVSVAEKVDLTKLIQSYKDECGVEAALRLIKLGRASPEDFCDDGQHGVDATVFPKFQGDLLKKLEPGIEQGEELKKELGIPSSVKVDESNVEELVGLYVKKYFDKIAASANQAESKKEGEE